MKTSTFHTKWYVTISALFFYLITICPVEGATLKGTVKGKNGQLKKYVRVEIGGPESKTTFTNEDGVFSILLSGGRYTIKIVERNRSMTFNVDVPKEKDKTKEVTFKLNW